MKTIFLSSAILPSFSNKSRNQKLRNVNNAKQVFACRRSESYSGRLVDESMIILRKRMHEMKMIERNYEPPEDWNQWEKQYYVCYDEFICKFVGFIQTQLINTRPSLALGMLMIITMSVPASMVVILSQLIEVGDKVLSAVHLG